MSDETFSGEIILILENRYGPELGKIIFSDSPIIGYLVRKTKAANRGSKSRGSFATPYAIYVLAEDYIKKGFVECGGYSQYKGARFSEI